MQASSKLVGVIEDIWQSIQKRHPDTPPVIVTLGDGSSGGGLTYGHFAPKRWVSGNNNIHELFISGEGLARGAAATLGTGRKVDHVAERKHSAVPV